MICLRIQIYLFLLQTGFFTMWSLEIDSLLEPASSIHFPMCFISPSRFSVKQFYVSTQDNTCEHIEEFLMDKQSWRADVVINTFGWQVKVAGLIRVRHTDFCWVCVRKSIRHKFCLIKQSYLLWWPQGAASSRFFGVFYPSAIKDWWSIFVIVLGRLDRQADLRTKRCRSRGVSPKDLRWAMIYIWGKRVYFTA